MKTQTVDGSAESAETEMSLLTEGVMPAWTCVMSGKSDNDDEEFERPFPDVFPTREEAVECAMDELDGLIGKSSYSPGDRDEVRAAIRKDLTESGRAVFMLTDGLMKEWNIWWTPFCFTPRQRERECPAKDIGEMTEGQLLRELVDRFIRYDLARDRYVDFLQHRLISTGVEYEDGRYEKLHMEQDERFCLCREIVRLVKNSPDAMWC